MFEVRAAWLASSPGSAHNGNKHAVDIVATRELTNRPRANAELRSLGQLLQHGVRTVGGVGNGNGRNRELAGGGNELRGAGIDGQRSHLQPTGMLTAHIECRVPIEPRTSQDGQREGVPSGPCVVWNDITARLRSSKAAAR